MEYSFDGRVALVTGAAGDLGRAAAVWLAADGASVAVCDLPDRADALAAVVEACRSANPAASLAMTTFDVTDPGSVGEALASVIDEIGVPDAVYNNAGYQGSFANTADYDVDDFRRVQDINVTGVFVVLRACANALLAIGRPGAIVVSGPPTRWPRWCGFCCRTMPPTSPGSTSRSPVVPRNASHGR